MNEYNNESNRGPVTPYKATGNLNTTIGNPQVNINDTMNVNIQSMATNSVSPSAPVTYTNTNSMVQGAQVQNPSTNINTNLNNQSVQNIPNVTSNAQNIVQSVPVNNVDSTIVEAPRPNPNPVYINQSINNETLNNQVNTGVQRTYVTAENKPKKKTLSLSLGPEFKIGLLIIVILLVFVLFLPMISDLLNGY